MCFFSRLLCIVTMYIWLNYSHYVRGMLIDWLINLYKKQTLWLIHDWPFLCINNQKEAKDWYLPIISIQKHFHALHLPIDWFMMLVIDTQPLFQYDWHVPDWWNHDCLRFLGPSYPCLWGSGSGQYSNLSRYCV